MTDQTPVAPAAAPVAMPLEAQVALLQARLEAVCGQRNAGMNREAQLVADNAMLAHRVQQLEAIVASLTAPKPQAPATRAPRGGRQRLGVKSKG